MNTFTGIISTTKTVKLFFLHTEDRVVLEVGFKKRNFQRNTSQSDDKASTWLRLMLSPIMGEGGERVVTLEKYYI